MLLESFAVACLVGQVLGAVASWRNSSALCVISAGITYWSWCYCLVSVMVEVRFPGLSQWKSKPVELMKWLIKESQAQLSPRPSVLGLLNWEAAGVTEAAHLVCAHKSGLWAFPVST